MLNQEREYRTDDFIYNRRNRIFRFTTLSLIPLLILATTLSSSRADEPIPRNDPSALTGPAFGDLPEDLPPANEGALEGGTTGTAADTSAGNVLQEEDQRDSGIFNVPSNGPPSPLFGAQPFTQKLLRFEEFGPGSLVDEDDAVKPAGWQPMPMPPNAQSAPDGLDEFLGQEIWPHPTQYANTQDLNPWKPLIESYLGRKVKRPPAEGRPPGQGWAHQRWDEFHPVEYFQTVTAGARVNGGLRDAKQLHGYAAGEFGPGGLYHNTTGIAGFEGTTTGIEVRFHPNMPVQDETTLWTFDGTFPPKLLNVRYGEPVIMRHYNALPVDVAANRGFGLHTLSTHEHNGHNPAESDGYTNAFFFPGQFYDYRWPITLAGYDSINTDASDLRAGTPDGNGGIRKVRGDWRETMSTHWFHDHMLDFTAQNVYKGSAAMMNYYSALDRGNEAIEDGVNLRLPSGTALDWGNRDYDVNLVIADKAWDDDGQLWFNPFNIKGFIGDVMTVNWLYKPYMDVRERRYRFRLLNGSVSRYFKLGFVDAKGKPVPFYMVANDGNIMEHSVYFENGELPTQGIAERYDIIIDFGAYNKNDRIYMVNLLQHKNGQVTDVAIPMSRVADGDYVAELQDDDGDGNPDRWVNGDPAVGAIMEFRVHKYSGVDLSMDPADFVAGEQSMIPLRRPTEDELANALHRSFEFEKEPTDETPWVIETDGGKGFGMDPRRLSAAPEKNWGGLEVWRLVNSGTWSHPVHIHFEEGIILRRDGKPPPEWEYWARKDVYRLGPQPDSGTLVEIALRFREFAGTFMEHCHNTQHEDHAMLLRWDIENPGQTKLMPTPMPSWDGVSYVDTVALPTARTGDAIGEYGPQFEPLSSWVRDFEFSELDSLADNALGDAFDPEPGPDNERGVATYKLSKGTNIDEHGNETEVWFFLHDISDEELAEEMGLAWAGRLVSTPVAATAEASVSNKGVWTFYGDLPNPITALNGGNPAGIPPQDPNNTYSPLRRVRIDGKDVVVNAIFAMWGDEPWEHPRIDQSCVAFPDQPPNTDCMYNGNIWGHVNESGHMLALVTEGPDPYASYKLHKSWSAEGDYLPYYVVLDSWPAGPANAMGVPYVPKHQFLADAAVPLVQFLPKTRLRPSYPPTQEGFGLIGGGPFGSQVGVPSYFMPEDDYSPMWHIGFARWKEEATQVVKGLDTLKQLRAEGKLEILELPPTNTGANDYDFESLFPKHVVNCPTPLTVDSAIHRARSLDR